MLAQSTESRPFVVTEAQRRHFETMGFVVFRQLFSPSDVAEIGAAFERVLTKAAAKSGYDGSKRLTVVPFIEADAFFLELFDDERIMGVVEGILGEDCFYTGGSDGNYYVGNTRWHPDGGMPGYWTAKTAFYLDPVGADSGCLSVIAGSHQPGFHDLVRRDFASGLFDNNSPDVPGRTPLVSQPGDLVIFNHALWHSSWGGHAGRRMFTINWAANPTPGWQTSFFRGYVESFVSRKNGLRLYSDRLVQTAGPRRRRKLQRMIELGYYDDPNRRPISEDSLVYMY